MTDIPIIFSAPMVLALLREARESGTGKQMTRRLAWTFHDVGDNHTKRSTPWQRVKPGDRLWVREAHWRLGWWRKAGETKGGRQRWTFEPLTDKRRIAVATGATVRFDQATISKDRLGDKHQRGSTSPLWWKRPAIFLPREFSRLTLVVTATKVEPLQDISEQDAIKEGVEKNITGYYGVRGPLGGWLGSNFATARDAFSYLWMSLHGAKAWDENPEVVALSFKVHAVNVDALKEAA